ncbi:Facilitated trehalose transporter Tret1-like protein [Leptotrombidium deliense]|uniref:Facilitated trehalose transporter Tret1-like protein n=1 Tax=Leptotrombidium deliense TaxID=299467 RepID=A0A443SUR7_9ACAR|nr:Facilitated trehalose transporter Tret1-like protein [Leptotrombidium deliense]
MPRFEASYNVYIAAGAALLGGICFGTAIGYTSPALETMVEKTGDNSTNRIAKKGDESIVGSSVAIGAVFGSIAAGFMSQSAGRQKILVIIGVPFAMGCGVIFIAGSLTLVIIGRLIIGFFTGIISAVSPSYVVEISTPNIRGFLGTGFQVCVTIGVFLMALCGIFATISYNYFFNWRYLVLVSAIPAIAMSILMLFVPESPHWLIAKYGRSSGRPEQALSRLRTSKSDIQGELDEMDEQINQTKNLTFTIDMFKKPEYWKPLVLGITLFVFQQFSGINVMLFFQTQILRNARGNDDASEEESANYASIGTAISTFVRIVATVCAAFLIDRVGRRKLLLVSGGGHAISLCVLGFYFYSKGPAKVQANNNATVTEEFSLPTYIPVLCLVAYMIAFSLGYGPIPWLMVPEMTPVTARSIIVSIALTVNWSCVFITTFTFAPLIGILGSAVVFWSYSSICVLSCVFVLLFLPETKGKTFDEIQRDLTGKKKEQSTDLISAQPKQSPEKTTVHVPPDEQTQETITDAPPATQQQISPLGKSTEQTVEPATGQQASPLEQNRKQTTVPVIFAEPKESPGQHPTVSKDDK